MQPRTCLLSALALSAAMCFGLAAMAADLPKEGTYSATYSGYGTYKATPVGKERLLLVFDQNGLSVGNGLMDHLTQHCWGIGDFTNGVGATHGYCVATDPEGDQLVVNFVDEKHPIDQKSFKVSGTLTSGTGKFAGISGEHRLEVHPGEFRPATEGTFFNYGTMQGSYRLP
jgi:hypothetical protein